MADPKQVGGGFIRGRRGSVAIIVAITLPLLLLLFAFGIDYARTTYHINNVQNALDASVLAGAKTFTTDEDPDERLKDVEAAALQVFTSNLRNMPDSAEWQNFNVAVAPQDGTGEDGYVATVDLEIDGLLSNSFVSGFLDRQGSLNSDYNLSSTARFTTTNGTIELAIAVDASSGGSSPSNVADAVNVMFEGMFGQNTDMEHLSISVIPFSDAVKITPAAVSNNWLQIPYSNQFNFEYPEHAVDDIFGGCMSIRKDNNAVTDEPPSGDFPRYLAIFEYPDLFEMTAISVNGTVWGPMASLGADGTWDVVQSNLSLGPQMDGFHIEGGRFDQRIDFVAGIGTESVQMELDSRYQKAFFEINLTNDDAAVTHPTRGSEPDMAAVTEFIGGTLHHTAYNLRVGGTNTTKVRSTPGAQQIVLSAVDNGDGMSTAWNNCGHNRYNDLSTGVWLKDSFGECILDNSDFDFWLSYFPICDVSDALLFSNDRTDVVNHLRGMSVGGPLRMEVGAAWAYYALSPNWRGLLGNADLPTNYGDERKVAVIIATADTINSNMVLESDSGVDSGELTTQICEDMRSNGIELYTVAYQASNATAQLLADCALFPDRAFVANTPQALEDAFELISNTLRPVTLVD